MRATFSMVGAAILVTALTGYDLQAHPHDNHRGFNISMENDDDVVDCSDLVVKNDGHRIPVTRQALNVTGSSLKVRSDQNGPVHVSASPTGQWVVDACHASVPGSVAGTVTLVGNELRAGGASGRSIVYLIVRAPRGASLDVETRNAPLSVKGIHGTLKAHASNGPISVKDSSGTLDVSTTNGPISLTGGSGTVKLIARNGPVSVKLPDGSWNGNLEAHTENGPMSLKLSRDFRSTVVAESDGHGPVVCRAEGCPDIRRWSDREYDDHRFQLGSGPAVVRVSTRNGPLTVKNLD